ncbi:MAG: response regulator [Alphaproteobacteria bacterium]|nr:response regulator [Alphaproteobacteria bacterium]
MAIILVVDDQKPVRDTIRIGLEMVGYDVIEAGDGAQGLQRLEEQRFDLIITDVVMPVMDGVAFVKTVRGRFPNLPILTISGGGGALPAAYSLKMTEMFGAGGVLYKPFTPDELLESVQRLIGAPPS